VINVLGVLNGELYGIAWDKRAFMHSEDSGATWMAVSYAQFAKAKADAGYQAALDVPWVKQGATQPLDSTRTTAEVSYTQSNYGGKFYDNSIS